MKPDAPGADRTLHLGERLFLSGRVLDVASGRALPHARLDVWQPTAAGACVEDDPGHPAWDAGRDRRWRAAASGGRDLA